MAAIGLMMAMSVNAQYLNDSKTPFTQGKTYVGASLSSTDLSYNGLSKGHLGINGKVGYFFADNLLGTAQVAYEKYKDVPYSIILGAGGRYYIEQNGLYLQNFFEKQKPPVFRVVFSVYSVQLRGEKSPKVYCLPTSVQFLELKLFAAALYSSSLT